LVKAETLNLSTRCIDSLVKRFGHAYKPKGIMIGYELSEEDLKSFAVSETNWNFKLPWKTPCLSEKGVDFFGDPSRAERIYRVARKEFWKLTAT